MKFSDLPSYTEKTLQRARELRKEMTPTEWDVWNYLRDKQLGVKFRRQVPIGKYIADFFAIEIGLVIEIDGGQHYTVKNQKNDQKRTNYFMKYGIKVIRFNNYEVATNIDGVFEMIIKHMNELKGL